jgi:hypothetical protein
MIDLMEQASLDLWKALAIAALLCPDGITDKTEHIDAAFAALEDAVKSAKHKLDNATRLALSNPALNRRIAA